MSLNESSDEIDRIEVSASLQPQLRLYRRLLLARIDLEEAKAALVELLERKIPLPRRALPSPLLLSLTTALVVAYARPFIHSRGASSIAEKAVPGVILKPLTSKQRELHEALLELRNKEIAHSDADILDISVRLFPDGDSAIFKNVREPFMRNTLRSIFRIIEKLEVSIDQRCEELRCDLPHQVWL